MKRRMFAIIIVISLFSILLVNGKRYLVYGSPYISREEFIEMVVLELGLKTDRSLNQPYINAALREGIITKSTFSSKFDVPLTCSDAAVVLVRADECLYGVTVSNEAVEMVINKRISDIKKVSKARQPFVAKCYYLGYITGSSNGDYSTDRKFKPSEKMSESTAKQLVLRIKNKEKREVVAEDGQLTRKTDLPWNADMYPYILASYPNAYYDWEFRFMKHLQGIPIYGTDKWINLVNYAAPVDVSKYDEGKYYYKDLTCIPEWEEKTRRHLEAIFNVDYKNIRNDKEWFQTVLETSEEYETVAQEGLENRIRLYIEAMTANKTIIEADKIAFDMTTLYIDNASNFIRVYVHYRINSALKTGQEDSASKWGLSSVIFSNWNHPDLKKVKLEEWRDGYFDVEVGSNGSVGVREVVISDYFHDVNVIRK